MSVVGVDLGTFKTVISVVGKGGIDTVTNNISGRKTASQVGFDVQRRSLGEVAKQNWKRNFRKTIREPKRLLGRSFSELDAEKDFAGACKFTQGENGEIQVGLFFKGEEYELSTEQIVAMLLTHIKELTEEWSNLPASDIVITVPGYWTDKRRRALLDAAQIAGLNVIRLVNDLTAVAINYLYMNRKRIEPEETRNILIVDVGGANTSAGVFQFKKSGLKTLGCAYDQYLGGRDIDRALADFFAERFLAKTGANIKEAPKSWLRLLTACEGVKKNLNIGGDYATISEICIIEDFDLSDKITREEYDELLRPLTERLQNVIQSALNNAQISTSDLHSVEWVGGTMRVEQFKEAASAVVGRPVENHLNADEAASHGAALQCAYVSPRIKLQNQFAITEIQDNGIIVTWQAADGSDEPQSLPLVKTRGKASYKSKQLTLKRPCKPMNITLSYEEHEFLGPDDNPEIARYLISDIPRFADSDLQDIIVKFKYDHNFITKLVKAEVMKKIEVEYQEEVKMEVDNSTEEKKGDSTPDDKTDVEMGEAASTETPENDENGENTKTNEPVENKPEKQYVTKKKIEKKYSPLPFILQTYTLSQEKIKEYIALEKKFQEADRYQAEVEYTRNALESYVYKARSSLHDIWKEFVTSEETSTFSSMLNSTESWVYNEGANQPLDVYKAKLKELTEIGDKYALRYNEWNSIGDATAYFYDTVKKYKELATSGDEAYAHIENLDDIVKECDRVNELMSEKIELQQQLSKTDDPVVLSSDVRERATNLANYCQRILDKPKPKPKEEKKPEEKTEGKEDKEVKENTENTENTENADSQQPDEMEVDNNPAMDLD